LEVQRTIRRGFELDYLCEPPKPGDDFGARLYSKEIHSGIVTHATWLMIKAMPDEGRRQYEELIADSVVLYPTQLVAESGEHYDAMVKDAESDSLPWTSTLDLAAGVMVINERIDQRYISYRLPIGDFARKFGEFRQQAQEQEGRRSGSDKAWKVTANSMFGVLASEHLETNNFVAANIVTATARALAFGMAMSLNAVQTITDGSTYRTDQIPVCTFAECIQLQADYQLRRPDADAGIPFQDQGRVPDSDEQFTRRFRDHLKTFFEVEGQDYDRLFSLHELVHKECELSNRTTFDALACDGAGNYIKCTSQSGNWQVEGQASEGEDDWQIEDFSARGYGPDGKRRLQDWVLHTYRTDSYTEPPPIAEDSQLMRYKPARQRARKALKAGVPEVFCPLGMEDAKIALYKVVKPSAFVFQCPAQRKSFLRALDKFQRLTGCGFELLALRRSYGSRRRGSVQNVLTEIRDLIDAGERDFWKALNLSRLNSEITSIGGCRIAEASQMRQNAEERLFRAIDTRNLLPDGLMVGYFATLAKTVTTDGFNVTIPGETS
jgi:hypothetical protein